MARKMRQNCSVPTVSFQKGKESMTLDNILEEIKKAKEAKTIIGKDVLTKNIEKN